MTQKELIAAVKAAVSEGVEQGVGQALVELRRDDATRIQSALHLAESVITQLADCQAELRAAQADNRSLNHEVINNQTSANTWRDVAGRYKQQRDELKERVAELTAEVAALKRGAV